MLELAYIRLKNLEGYTYTYNFETATTIAVLQEAKSLYTYLNTLYIVRGIGIH